MLVRQLQPTAQGMPIELYFFSADTAWLRYEHLQAEVFDHMLAILNTFNLKVFQAFKSFYKMPETWFQTFKKVFQQLLDPIEYKTNIVVITSFQFCNGIEFLFFREFRIIP